MKFTQPFWNVTNTHEHLRIAINYTLKNPHQGQINSVFRLILCRGGDFFLDAEVTKERFNLIFAQRAWVAKIMEEDEATHPIEVAFFCAVCLMF